MKHNYIIINWAIMEDIFESETDNFIAWLGLATNAVDDKVAPNYVTIRLCNTWS
jgi:hypothetical protein